MTRPGQATSEKATAWYVIPGDNYLVRWFNALHWPYTVWHLSYVVIGASLADELRVDVLGWALLAFFLGMGVGGHVLDLLQGDPLALRLPRAHLVVVAVVSLALAVAVGVMNSVWGNVANDEMMALVILAGVIMAVLYNMEQLRFHGDAQFALFWGVFPLVVGFWAMGGGEVLGIISCIYAGGFAFVSALAQRVLSTRVRYLRRQIMDVQIFLQTGEKTGVGRAKPWLLEPLDRALMLLSFALPALAASLFVWRMGS